MDSLIQFVDDTTNVESLNMEANSVQISIQKICNIYFDQTEDIDDKFHKEWRVNRIEKEIEHGIY